MLGLRQGLVSSELLISGGDVHSILLLTLVVRCLETIDVYMVHGCFFVRCSDCDSHHARLTS